MINITDEELTILLQKLGFIKQSEGLKTALLFFVHIFSSFCYYHPGTMWRKYSTHQYLFAPKSISQNYWGFILIWRIVDCNIIYTYMSMTSLIRNRYKLLIDRWFMPFLAGCHPITHYCESQIKLDEDQQLFTKSEDVSILSTT